MKRKLGKVVALILCLVVMLTAASCGKSGNSGDGGKTVISMYFPGDTNEDQALVNEEISKYVEEKLGFGVEINVIDRGTYDEKMTMMIAGGDDYDICFTSNWTNQYVANVSKNAYLELDDMLKDTPGLTETVPAYIWESIKQNGKIYGVPSYQLMFSAPALRVPDKLVEKYKLSTDPMKKLQDLEPFLKTIKENEPDLYPFQVGMSTYHNYEGLGIPLVYIEKDTKDYKLSLETEQPEYKEKLALMRDWYKKGYIRQDIITMTGDRADIANQRYAVMSSTWEPGGTVQFESTYGYDVDQIRMDVEPYVGHNVGKGSIMAINKQSKHPKEALKFLELLATDKEVYNMLCFGIEGKHYKKISDNSVEVFENTKYRQGSIWMFGNQFNAYYSDGQEEGLWEEIQRIGAEEAKKSPLLGFSFNQEPVKNEIANVKSVQAEYAWITTGGDDYEAIWDEYVNKLEKAGLRTIYKEAQKQVTEWAKANGKIK